MEKGTNFNHPKKGERIKVEPIRSLNDIKNIKRLLKDKPRNLTLFTLGINTNLRASDLLGLKVGQVFGLKPMEEIEVKEKKTGKIRRITINKGCVDAIQELLASKAYEDADYLFQSKRGGPLTVPSLTRLVKEWTKAIHLKGNYGSHTLRKSWGYHQRVTFGAGIPELMECFGHATQRQTLTYLCVQPEEIRSVYANQL